MDKQNSVLFTRRSVRVFNDKPVAQEDLDYILKAAMYAPSGTNSRPWQYIVSRKREHFIKMLEASKYYAALNTADSVVIVCYDKDKLFPEYSISDCSCTSLYMQLAAKERGVGSVWLAINGYEDREQAARELFKLPDNLVPFSMLAFGNYNDNIPMPSDRYDASKIHLETFKG